MKCVLCQFDNDQLNKVKEHYVKQHNVDENNKFFQKLINKNEKVLHWGKCHFCNEFVLKKDDHNFLKHYGRGFTAFDGNDNVPVINTNVGGIRKFEITFKEHASDYDFFDPVAVVDKFLAQVKRLVQRYDNDVLIRAVFQLKTFNNHWTTTLNHYIKQDIGVLSHCNQNHLMILLKLKLENLY